MKTHTEKINTATAYILIALATLLFFTCTHATAQRITCTSFTEGHADSLQVVTGIPFIVESGFGTGSSQMCLVQDQAARIETECPLNSHPGDQFIWLEYSSSRPVDVIVYYDEHDWGTCVMHAPQSLGGIGMYIYFTAPSLFQIAFEQVGSGPGWLIVDDVCVNVQPFQQ